MLAITPQTKVGDLLEAYPNLEDKLLELSPKFAHLKNPVLRRTVARIATLQQAAQIGGISVEMLVNTLRKEVGLANLGGTAEQNWVPKPPVWIDKTYIHNLFDITAMIESGEHPLGKVLEMINQLPSGKTLLIIAPFYPAPLADIAKDKGIEVYSKSDKDKKVETYFFKP